MLRGVDRALELVGWTVALMLAIMLFVGPQVVAEDRPAEEGGESAGAAPYAGQASTSDGTSDDGGGESAADGEALFGEHCGSCHTLSAAGTSGSVGPNLDDTTLDAAGIESIVRDGSGGMPSFEGDLSEEEIAAVARFVADN
jgi:mono/diheme cytochrome c family protein